MHHEDLLLWRICFVLANWQISTTFDRFLPETRQYFRFRTITCVNVNELSTAKTTQKCLMNNCFYGELYLVKFIFPGVNILKQDHYAKHHASLKTSPNNTKYTIVHVHPRKLQISMCIYADYPRVPVNLGSLKSNHETCLYNFNSLKPHFYIGKLGFIGLYIISLISAKNIDCGYSLEPPWWGGSNEYLQSMVWAEIWKNIRIFLCEKFHFWW